jgi:hypothetical protein
MEPIPLGKALGEDLPPAQNRVAAEAAGGAAAGGQSFIAADCERLTAEPVRVAHRPFQRISAQSPPRFDTTIFRRGQPYSPDTGLVMSLKILCQPPSIINEKHDRSSLYVYLLSPPIHPSGAA